MRVSGAQARAYVRQAGDAGDALRLPLGLRLQMLSRLLGRRTARLALPRATRGALGLTELLGAREDGVDALRRVSITLARISITYMQ